MFSNSVLIQTHFNQMYFTLKLLGFPILLERWWTEMCCTHLTRYLNFYWINHEININMKNVFFFFFKTIVIIHVSVFNMASNEDLLESVKYLGYTIVLIVLISLLIWLVYTAYYRYHILTQDMFNFAYVINSKCNKSYLPGV